MISWCCMCRCNGESVDYLLIHCTLAGTLWNFVLRSFGIQWVWRECNRHTFEDIEKSARQLLDCFVSLLFEWSLAWGFRSSTTDVQFLSSLFIMCISSDSLIP